MSARIRMYLIIGTAVLAAISAVVVILLGPNKVTAWLESKPLALIVFLTATGILTGYLRIANPELEGGRLFKLLGSGLIIFGLSAALLFNLSDTVSVTALVLGFIASVTGTIQARAAHRRAKATSPGTGNPEAPDTR